MKHMSLGLDTDIACMTLGKPIATVPNSPIYYAIYFSAVYLIQLYLCFTVYSKILSAKIYFSG